MSAVRPPATSVPVVEDGSVWALPVRTPFTVGSVNAYLIEDEPLTLVDCGPNSATALDDLERLLAARGYALTDVELVLVTHQHIDHVGLAASLSRRGGARIACLQPLAPYLEHWEAASIQDDEYAYELMVRHGVEPAVAGMVRAAAHVEHGWGATTRVDERLDPGRPLRFADRELTVHHLPGHSPSDTVFVDAARGVAFVGDLLVGHVPSTTLASRPLDDPWDGRRPTPLLDYRRALAAIAAGPAAIALPGHGAPVADPRALIAARLAAQDTRAAQLLERLRVAPSTAHALGLALRPRAAQTQVFATLSDTLGHLDLVVADGTAVEVETDGDVALFCAI